MPQPLKKITITEVLAKYDAVLFDAFGVLVNGSTSLDGAAELVDRMNQDSHEYFILTNGSSGSPQHTQQKYADKGLKIPVERIITSGSLVKDWVKKNKLEGQGCYVIGPDSSREMVLQSGIKIAHSQAEINQASMVIVCDQSGVDFPEDINTAISLICQRLDLNNPEKEIKLLLPNPDLFFPASNGSYSVTAGSIAEMIERVLAVRYPEHDNITFERLGKPYHPIFEKAFQQTKTMNMALIGDQVITDILGANQFGIDSILIGTGITKTDDEISFKISRPDYIMDNLSSN